MLLRDAAAIRYGSSLAGKVYLGSSLIWPSGTLWSPSEVGSDLLMHLDASETSSLTLSGNNVTAWSSPTDNPHSLIPAGGNPTYSATAWSGLPAVRFSSSAGLRGGAYNLKNNSDPWTAVFAIDHDGAFTGRTELFDWSAGRFIFGTIAANENWTVFSGSEGWQISAMPPIAGKQIVTLISGAAETTIRLNGGPSFTVPVNSNIPLNGLFGFGAYWDGAFGIEAWISEAVFASNQDAAGVDRIEGYLAHKWGLAASLPADHPYKASAP